MESDENVKKNFFLNMTNVSLLIATSSGEVNIFKCTKFIILQYLTHKLIHFYIKVMVQ